MAKMEQAQYTGSSAPGEHPVNRDCRFSISLVGEGSQGSQGTGSPLQTEDQLQGGRCVFCVREGLLSMPEAAAPSPRVFERKVWRC